MMMWWLSLAAVASEELRACVERGDLAGAAQLAEALPRQEALTAAQAGIAAYRARLVKIVALGQRAAIPPSFRWAQNASHVFFEIKFAHKLSAPAATDATVEEILVADSTLSVVASSSRGRWGLAIDTLWGNVDWVSRSETSAGRLSLTVAKAQGSHFRWPRLLQCGVSMPANAALWFDMQEALGGFNEDDDDDDCKSLADTPVPTEQDKASSKDATTKESAAAKKPTLSPEERRKRNQVKTLKKQAAASRKTVSTDVGRRKRRVNADAAAASGVIRDDYEARLLFLQAPPAWARPFLRFLVRDGIWNVVALVTRRGPGAPLTPSASATLLLFGSLLLSGILLQLLLFMTRRCRRR